MVGMKVLLVLFVAAVCLIFSSIASANIVPAVEDTGGGGIGGATCQSANQGQTLVMYGPTYGTRWYFCTFITGYQVWSWGSLSYFWNDYGRGSYFTAHSWVPIY